MSRIFIRGCGAVSPAGWGVSKLIEALENETPFPSQPLASPGGTFQVRTVPPPSPRPACLQHPRLRRASAISQYATAAAAEALMKEGSPSRLGIVVGVHAASIRYSERFFAEVLRDPATASPLIFPETVINAPASHLAANLSITGLSYSVLGDQTAFIQALMVGAGWLAQDRADAVLVIGAEETAWTVSASARFFARDVICSEGAGAICLSRDPGPGAVELTAVTDPCLLAGAVNRSAATTKIAQQFLPGAANELLCDSRAGSKRWDAFETNAWRNWAGEKISPRAILGEGLSAATAWQFIVAIERLRSRRAASAVISVAGSNLQSIGCRLTA